MSDSLPSAAQRVAANSLIMGEVFGWVEKKRDLRSCMVTCRDNFVGVLKPLYDMSDEGVYEGLIGRGCPQGRLLQYRLAVSSVQYDSRTLSDTASLISIRNTYPSLKRIKISRLDNHAVEAIIEFDVDTGGGNVEGKLDLRCRCADLLIAVRLPHLVRNKDCLRLQSIAVTCRQSERDKLTKFLDFDSDTGVASPASSLLLSQWRAVELNLELVSAESLEPLLRLFPEVKELRLQLRFLSLPCTSVSELYDTLSVVLGVTSPAYIDLGCHVDNPIRNLKHVDMALDLLPTIVERCGVRRLGIQHDFCYDRCIGHIGHTCRLPTSPRISGLDELERLDIEPVQPWRSRCPRMAAETLHAALPASVQTRFLLAEDLPGCEPDPLHLQWIAEANQALHVLRYPNKTIGFRKLASHTPTAPPPAPPHSASNMYGEPQAKPVPVAKPDNEGAADEAESRQQESGSVGGGDVVGTGG